MKSIDLLAKVKENLIITFNDDDGLIRSFITAAISYAEGYQHLTAGTYKCLPMSPTTEQAVIMLASFFYESRDGGTGGFFANNSQGAEQVWKTVNLLLRMDKNWEV